MHKCAVHERFVCVLSEAKKQAPVDSYTKARVDILHSKIKLLSNSVTLYIVKREKAIQKECVPPIQERTKLLSKREEREERHLCKSCCFSLMQPSYGLSLC